VLAICLCALSGCGAGDSSLPKARAACQDGFVNDTNLPTGHDSDPIDDNLTPQTGTLWNLWHISQRDLSTQPISYLNRSSVPPLPQAAAEPPKCQAVVSVPDLPGGGFRCSGMLVDGCFTNDTVYVAESVAWHSVWEMENAILCRYDKCQGR
jgi:hypothetical protein